MKSYTFYKPIKLIRGDDFLFSLAEKITPRVAVSMPWILVSVELRGHISVSLLFLPSLKIPVFLSLLNQLCHSAGFLIKYFNRTLTHTHCLFVGERYF